jgi:hypothetical protein
MWRRSPPAVMLPPGVSTLPTFTGEKKMMTTTHPPQPQSRAPLDLMAFFQTEREIWVQNLTTTQLSMQFEIAPGHVAGVLILVLPHPVCLTNEVPFDAIKKSLDFRKFIAKNPPIMKLMSTEEAEAFFAERARMLGAYTTDATGAQVPDVWAARAEAEAERAQLMRRDTADSGTVVGPNGQVTFTPPKSALELQGYTAPHMGMSAEAAQASGAVVPQGVIRQAAGFGVANLGAADVPDVPVNPRVVDLCHQVSTQLEESLRMKPEPFFRALKQLEGALTLEDLQYVESFGTYKTVKNWARKLQAERTAGQEVDDGLML